jgi:hypothetical protein
MDNTRQQNRPRDLILDSQIHSYERRQTPLHDGVHVPSVQGTCYQSGSHRVEGLYRWAHLNSLLCDTDLSPRHVQQLLKLGGLDQTVHLQDTPNYALPVDLLEHIPSRQTQGYLHNKKANKIMQQINVLLDLAPEEVPEDS